MKADLVVDPGLGGAPVESRLDPRRFVRPHRSAIVNLAAVREFHRLDEQPRLVLADGTTVPVSRRRRARIIEALRRWANATR